VIGFERMLHAQQKPKPQNSEHMPPARPETSSNTKSPGLSGRPFHNWTMGRRKAYRRKKWPGAS
jgi:hypothetical protein